MSLTIATILTPFNTYLGDASNDRVTAAERLQYVTEATIWLQESLQNDHQVKTYELDYLDTVNYYRVTTPLADLLDGSDLRRRKGENFQSMAHKSSRELSEEISNKVTGDDSWAIERRDGQTFLAINASPKFTGLTLDAFESSAGIAYWVADTTNSDALAATQDLNRFLEGSSSMNFDITVAQSANDRATFANSTISYDLETFDGIGVFLLDVDIPDVTNITSFTLYWGNSSTVYWSATVTTDLDGSAFVNGWNTLAFDWAVATATSSPDATAAIDYFRIDMNYAVGQANDTDFRYDYFRVAKPEPLTFHYVSWDIGTNSSLADVLVFGATTDIPFFSGQYDQYKYAVAHMAASIAFDNLRLKDNAAKEEQRAYGALQRVQRIFPKSITKEVKSFKVLGIRFNK